MESATGNQVPMEDKLAARFAELEEKIKNMPQEEQDRVRDAYTYAKEHHDGQLRKDGSPYIMRRSPSALASPWRTWWRA